MTGKDRTADHRVTSTGRTKCLSKTKANPPRDAHHFCLTHMQGSTLSNPPTIQSYFARLLPHLTPSNSCRATSAVSRWADGVATQFVSLTLLSCEMVVQQQSVHETMHECTANYPNHPSVSCSAGQISIRSHLLRYFIYYRLRYRPWTVSLGGQIDRDRFREY
jgi:hypothetical protein